MSEQMNAPMLPPPSGVSEWFSVWRAALTKPSDQTFATIAQSPNAKLTTALLWVFLGSLVNALFASLVQGAIIRQMMQNSDFGGNGFPQMGGGLVAAICGAPVGAVVSVVAFMIFVGIVQLIAKMFGGRGTFDQLAYATAAIVAPFSLINSVLTSFDCHPICRTVLWTGKLTCGCLCHCLGSDGSERRQSIWLGAGSRFLLPAIPCSGLLCIDRCNRHPAGVRSGDLRNIQFNPAIFDTCAINLQHKNDLLFNQEVILFTRRRGPVRSRIDRKISHKPAKLICFPCATLAFDSFDLAIPVRIHAIKQGIPKFCQLVDGWFHGWAIFCFSKFQRERAGSGSSSFPCFGCRSEYWHFDHGYSE